MNGGGQTATNNGMASVYAAQQGAFDSLPANHDSGCALYPPLV